MPRNPVIIQYLNVAITNRNGDFALRTAQSGYDHGTLCLKPKVLPLHSIHTYSKSLTYRVFRNDISWIYLHLVIISQKGKQKEPIGLHIVQTFNTNFIGGKVSVELFKNLQRK